MSWLVNSIATSLNLDDDDDHHTSDSAAPSSTEENRRPTDPNPKDTAHDDDDDDQEFHRRQMGSFTLSSPQDETAAARGVKEDLSELSNTLSRQFWGVASFLARPPQISNRDPLADDFDEVYADEGAGIAGIRNELSEVGGEFGAGMSNDLEYESEEELTVEDYARRGVVGVTEEVVTFARDIALHPETWIDFPLPDDDIEEDVELSDAQQEHALAVECLAPELAALRVELCLSYMSEACFWKIYFALVHPRLSRHDAEILSTPEIVKARAMLSQELHGQCKPKPCESRSGNAFADNTMLSHEEHLSVLVVDKFESVPTDISAVGPTTSVEPDAEMDKHAVVSTEVPVIDKTVVEETPMKQTHIEKATAIISRIIDQKFEDDDGDDWLEEVNSETGPLKSTLYLHGDYDDISFSDLEDDEDVPSSFKKVGKPNEKVSSITLKNKESNDWLDIQDIGIA